MLWTTLITGALAAPTTQLGIGRPLHTGGWGAVQLSARRAWGWTAAEVNLSLDPYRDQRPTDFDGLGGFYLDQDWAVKGWLDLSPPAPGRSGFHAAPHLYLGALRWRGQRIPSASAGQTRGPFDGDGTWSWAPAAGVGVDLGYQRFALRGRVELSYRSQHGVHLLHQGAGIDLLVTL